YSRMWTKVLFDLGFIGFDEPFKKLLNQGMIQGVSAFAYRLNFSRIKIDNYDYSMGDIYISKKIKDILNGTGVRGLTLSKEGIELVDDDLSTIIIDELNAEEKNSFIVFANFFKNNGINDVEIDLDFLFVPIHVDISLLNGKSDELNLDLFRQWKSELSNSKFILDDGVFITEREVEKMSKSKYNTINPDDLCKQYGADTFRMYEMFLGPVEMSKPWDTKGIEGVHRFLKKFWRLFADETKGLIVTDEEPTAAELKVLHNSIKKIESDTERFSFNTAVSAFMIATNELTDLKCHKRKILEPLLILLAPYAPHITAELYNLLGSEASPLWGGLEGAASYPVFEEKYVKESTKAYPVAINGKTRLEITLPLEITQQQVEEIVLKNEVVQKWLEGKQPKKIIYVKNKMINVVV
ncbi:MAG: class I tRNA ligase family protein, partial [Chitinophagaceae bacterium]